MNSDKIEECYFNPTGRFQVPCFPGLLSELDLKTFFHTPPENELEASFHLNWNKEHFPDGKFAFRHWEKMTSRFPGIAPWVIILGFGNRLETNKNSYYAVINNGVSILVPYDGILSYFHERIKTSLVKNGLPRERVEFNFNCVNRLANWTLGYNENSGQIAVIDSGAESKNSQLVEDFVGGYQVPEPVLRL